ncbi:hypothetical protein ABZP36_025831 [Zizania latifolia]
MAWRERGTAHRPKRGRSGASAWREQGEGVSTAGEGRRRDREGHGAARAGRRETRQAAECDCKHYGCSLQERAMSLRWAVVDRLRRRQRRRRRRHEEEGGQGRQGDASRVLGTNLVKGTADLKNNSVK